MIFDHIKSLRHKVIVIVIMLSLPILCFVIFSLITLSQGNQKVLNIMLENESIHRASREALSALGKSEHDILGVFLLEEDFVIDDLENVERDHKEMTLTFSLYVKALTWGTETRVFKVIDGGKTYAEWQHRGLVNAIKISEPSEIVRQTAGSVDIYFSGFSKYLGRSIELLKKSYEAKKGKEEKLFAQYRKEALAQFQKAVMYEELVTNTFGELIKLTNELSVYHHALVKKQQRKYFEIFVAIGGFVYLLVILIVWRLSQRIIVDPLEFLTNQVREIGRGDWQYRLSVKRNDEIGQLANSFNEMKEDLRKTTVSRDLLKQEIEQKEKIQNQKERFYALSSDMIGVLGSDGYLKEINSLWGNVLGYSDEEMLQKAFISFVSDADKEKVASEIEALQRRTEGEVTFEAQMICSDLSQCTLRWKLVMDKIHEVIYMALENITDTKRLEERMQESTRMESVGRLAGGIAHDFNNLLTVIGGYCEGLEEDLDKESDAYDAVSEIKNAYLKASSLTQQLLAFSRKQVVRQSVVDCNEVVIQLSKMLKRLLHENMSFEIVPAKEPVKVKIDMGQLQQILMNLVVNAKDAVEENGSIQILIQKREVKGYKAFELDLGEGEYACLVVRDDGVGIDPKDVEHIFEPFFTTKKEGQGTGLGLSTSYGIVKQNKGMIEVESKKGVGTTLCIYLPLSLSEDMNTSSGGDAAPKQLKKKGKGVILLVEDEESVRGLLKLSLIKQGYEIVEAINGKEALEKIETFAEGEIRMFISDIVMPEMGGYELYQELQKRFPDMKGLLMSGYTDDNPALRAIRDTDVEFIQKPFTQSQFLMKVASILF